MKNKEKAWISYELVRRCKKHELIPIEYSTNIINYLQYITNKYSEIEKVPYDLLRRKLNIVPVFRKGLNLIYLRSNPILFSIYL